MNSEITFEIETTDETGYRYISHTFEGERLRAMAVETAASFARLNHVTCRVRQVMVIGEFRHAPQDIDEEARS